MVAVVGILLAARLWLGKRTLVTSIANSAPGRLLGTGGTTLGALTGCTTKCSSSRSRYCLVAETRSAELNDEHPAVLSRFAGKGLLLSENGYLRWYVASMSIGAVVVLALLMVLR